MTSAVDSPTEGVHDTPGRTRWSLKGMARRPEFGAVVATVLVYLFFAITTQGAGFVSIDGTAGWLDTAAELGIIAIPVGVLMVAGEFDLSVGSIVGASAVFLAIGTTIFNVPFWLMIAVVIFAGACVGFINGIITVRTGLPSFIVSLAASFCVAGGATGLARLLTNTTNISVNPPPDVHLLFGSAWGQANVSILWWIAVTSAAGIVLSRTAFGNWIYATGGDPVAARGAGVPTNLVKVVLFIATGAAAAFVGVIQGVEYHSGNATAGLGYVFQSIIVAVVGGVLLGGGYGSAFGVFLGTMIYGIINVGIFYTGWSTDWVQLFLGVLLLCAVLANSYFRRFAMSTW
jgi:simple sugar transport system permease protein